MLYVKVDAAGNPVEVAKTYREIKEEFLEKNSLIPSELVFSTVMGSVYKEVPYEPFPPCGAGKALVVSIPVKKDDGTYLRTFKEVPVEEVNITYHEGMILNKRQKLLSTYIDNISPARWEGFSEAEKDEVRSFRQSLLDITQAEGYPFVNMPEIPSFLKV